MALSSVAKIKDLKQRYAPLRNLVLIVKKLLSWHSLNKPYTGGLNSYSIVLMVSTFLETSQTHKKYSSATSRTLMDFFGFYGFLFDENKLGVNGTAVIEVPQNGSCLWVQDISNKANNTAKSAFRYD